jgi:hypothetical protein
MEIIIICRNHNTGPHLFKLDIAAANPEHVDMTELGLIYLLDKHLLSSFDSQGYPSESAGYGGKNRCEFKY